VHIYIGQSKMSCYRADTASVSVYVILGFQNVGGNQPATVIIQQQHPQLQQPQFAPVITSTNPGKEIHLHKYPLKFFCHFLSNRS